MGIKVAVVEDEIHIVRLLKMLLTDAGYEVVSFDQGQKLLTELQQGDLVVDAIFLDIMMPGIDGLQVLRTLKEHSRTKNIPVIMLTALAQPQVVKQGITLGASDYIRKPFKTNDVIARLQKVLKKS